MAFISRPPSFAFGLLDRHSLHSPRRRHPGLARLVGAWGAGLSATWPCAAVSHQPRAHDMTAAQLHPHGAQALYLAKMPRCQHSHAHVDYEFECFDTTLVGGRMVEP